MTKRVSKWLISSKWGIYIPLLQGFFVKNIAKFYVYDFLAVLLKFYWLTFKQKFMALAALGSCHVTSSRQG